MEPRTDWTDLIFKAALAVLLVLILLMLWSGHAAHGAQLEATWHWWQIWNPPLWPTPDFQRIHSFEV